MTRSVISVCTKIVSSYLSLAVNYPSTLLEPLLQCRTTYLRSCFDVLMRASTVTLRTPTTRTRSSRSAQRSTWLTSMKALSSAGKLEMKLRMISHQLKTRLPRMFVFRTSSCHFKETSTSRGWSFQLGSFHQQVSTVVRELAPWSHTELQQECHCQKEVRSLLLVWTGAPLPDQWTCSTHHSCDTAQLDKQGLRHAPGIEGNPYYLGSTCRRKNVCTILGVWSGRQGLLFTMGPRSTSCEYGLAALRGSKPSPFLSLSRESSRCLVCVTSTTWIC